MHAIINFYQNKKGRVYCAFVDYRKAFDFIDRSSLWLKLVENDVNGRVLNVIKSMYEHAKSCIRSDDKLSEFFSCGQGVRQGENLSPVLFAIYLNDFNDYIARNSLGLDDLNNHINSENEFDVLIRLYVLLYADDTVIMAESEKDLQVSLESLCEYCNMWNLEVNLTKTKIVIFSRGKVKKHMDFMYGNKLVEVVDDYTYLGVIFNYDGSFKKAIDKQIAQATKSMYALLQKVKILKLPIDITCQLYNACVIPVLLYGSEIWGFSDLDKVEKFHRNFYRIVLKTHKFTPNCMLYGEADSVDMITLINQRMINFWLKLENDDKSKLSNILCKILSRDFDNVSSSNNANVNECEEESTDENVISYKWIEKIKTVLDEMGFSSSWSAKGRDHLNFKTLFKQRSYDVFLQQWCSNVNSNSQCNVYSLFKEKPKFEKFMMNLDYVHRLRISNFIMRVHRLPVTRNRFHFTEDDPQTFCPLCDDNVVGDESHYLFRCSYFENERRRFLPNCITIHDASSMAIKWKQLFDLELKDLVKVSKFIKLIVDHFRDDVSNKSDKIDNDLNYNYMLSTKETKCGRPVIRPLRFR